MLGCEFVVLPKRFIGVFLKQELKKEKHILLALFVEVLRNRKTEKCLRITFPSLFSHRLCELKNTLSTSL